MDCVDVIIGTAKGTYSRIGDYYTRDRSTPLFDSYYGGTDGLTAAVGEEDGNYTRILFRRRLDGMRLFCQSVEVCDLPYFS